MRVKLKDVASFSKGQQINGDLLLESGQYDFLNGGIAPSGKWGDFNVAGGTVTISEGGNSCGYVNYMESPFWCGAHCYYLYNLKCDPKYFYYLLKSQQDRIMALRSGACMPNIKKTDLAEIDLEVCFEESTQKKIVAGLDKLSELIALRKQQLDKLDELVKARFVEMFGDPASNPFRWKKERFDTLCENLDSRRVPISASERRAGVYPYYGASGIVDYVNDYIFNEDILLISEDGANLVARVTPIAFSVKGKVWVNNHAHVVRFKQRYTQNYLEYYFALIDISSCITGTAQPKLNQAKLNAMSIPIPPESIQNRFWSFVQQVEKTRLTAQQGLDKLEMMKKALMQQYFG